MHDDTWKHVFTFLDMRDRVSTVSLVCTTWRRHVRAHNEQTYQQLKRTQLIPWRDRDFKTRLWSEFEIENLHDYWCVRSPLALYREPRWEWHPWWKTACTLRAHLFQEWLHRRVARTSYVSRTAMYHYIKLNEDDFFTDWDSWATYWRPMIRHASNVSPKQPVIPGPWTTALWQPKRKA